MLRAMAIVSTANAWPLHCHSKQELVKSTANHKQRLDRPASYILVPPRESLLEDMNECQTKYVNLTGPWGRRGRSGTHLRRAEGICVQVKRSLY